MDKASPAGAVLLLIDLQKAIDHPSWGKRNNPDAEARIGRDPRSLASQGMACLAHSTRLDRSELTLSTRPSGQSVQAGGRPSCWRTRHTEANNSAFIGTDLETRLRSHKHDAIVVVGVITNNSVEATVRMAGNLGFGTYLVADGCFTFGRRDWNGREWSAEDVHALSLANFDNEYCTVVTADEVLKFAD